MRVYFTVSDDKYELPEIYAYNIQAFADKIGVSRNVIECALSKYYTGKVKSCKYRCVDIEEEE
jgi:hypothetical protein